VDRHLVRVRPAGEERPDGAFAGVASATPTATAADAITMSNNKRVVRDRTTTAFRIASKADSFA
jgi:hypothetical protein